MKRTYKDIPYTLRRGDRKTGSIYIERDGSITVIVPEALTDADIDVLIERKRKWIYTHLAEWEDLNAARVEREYVNGEGFLYLGGSYRLRLTSDQKAPLMLKNGYFLLRSDHKDARRADAAFRAFYREKGNVRIPGRVALYSARMAAAPGPIRIIDLKNRWASCSETGHLNFHWKCMMAPPKILDYIVVHELAHLRRPNHTEAFWNEVDKVMPDYRERKAWLREHGAGMDL